MCPSFFGLKNTYKHIIIEIRKAVTATQRVHGWRIVERPLYIDARCEISGCFHTNKQSRTNSGLSTRVQEVGGWHRHPHQTLLIPYDEEATCEYRPPTNNHGPHCPVSGDDPVYGRQPRQKTRILLWNHNIGYQSQSQAWKLT